MWLRVRAHRPVLAEPLAWPPSNLDAAARWSAVPYQPSLLLLNPGHLRTYLPRLGLVPVSRGNLGRTGAALISRVLVFLPFVPAV